MATSASVPNPVREGDSVLSLYDAANNAGLQGMDGLAHSLALGDTRVFGPNTSTRCGLCSTGPPSAASRPTPSTRTTSAPTCTAMRPTSCGCECRAAFEAQNQGNSRFLTNASQVSDDFTIVRGDHQISFGANAAYWKYYFQTHARSGGVLDLHRPADRPGTGRPAHGPRRPARARRARHPADGPVVHGPLCAGHLARGAAGHDQWRPPLGAVLRPERHEWRRLQLQPRELPQQRHEPDVRERARRAPLSGRFRVPAGPARAATPVAEFLAARRASAGM